MEIRQKITLDRGKITTVFLLAILIMSLLVIKSDDALPMPFGYGMAVVLSNSMEPALVLDDLVIIKKTDNIAAGDIIVYQSGQELVIHRVVEYDGQTVVTKGDANNTNDEPFDSSQVKGILVVRIPLIGRVITLLKTPYGLMIATVFIFMMSGIFSGKRDE